MLLLLVLVGGILHLQIGVAGTQQHSAMGGILPLQVVVAGAVGMQQLLEMIGQKGRKLR